MTAPGAYEIRVDGHLDDHWAAWLGHVTAARQDDGTTTLILRPGDAAAVHAALTSLRDIGATVLSLRRRGVADAPCEHRTDAATTGPAPLLDRVLTTARLTLRPATADDADSTWAYRRLPAVGEWLVGVPGTRAGYRGLFTRPDRLAATVVIERGHGRDARVVGDVVLRREDARAQDDVREQARGRQAEVGAVLDPEHSGRGYATEALRGLLGHCFTDGGLHRVVARCFLADERSRRLVERVGMRREAHAVRDVLHRSGRWRDSVTYAVLADEWPYASSPPDPS